MGVCFPCAALRADSQHVPAQGGEQRGRCDWLRLHSAPHCLSSLTAVFVSVVLRDSACGFCVWGDCRDLKGCTWGKAKLSLHVCMLWITHLGLAHSLCVGCSFAQAKTHMGVFRLSTCANWRISYLTIGPKTQNWWFTGSAKITGHILWWKNLALHYWNWRSFADLHQLRIWA